MIRFVWDLYVFDWFEAAAAALGSKMSTEIFVPDLAPQFADIPILFCAHISWVALECSAKSQDSTKRRPFYIEKITLLHFSPSLYWSFNSNDLDLGKWQPF